MADASPTAFIYYAAYNMIQVSLSIETRTIAMSLIRERGAKRDT